jgi:hypothetical protein
MRAPYDLDGPVDMQVARVRAERIELCCSKLIARGRTEWSERHALDAIRVDLRTYILGMGAHRIEIHERWPAGWWQAVRERWAPAWWLRRFPVRYERIDVERKIYAAVCPHIDAPNDGPHIEFLAFDGPIFAGERE